MKEGVCKEWAPRLHREVAGAGPDRGNMMWHRVISWLQPVPSIGLSPVPLGGIPNLAMSVSPSLVDHFFQTVYMPRAFPTQKPSPPFPYKCFSCPAPLCLPVTTMCLFICSPMGLCISLQTSFLYSALSSCSWQVAAQSPQ